MDLRPLCKTLTYKTSRRERRRKSLQPGMCRGFLEYKKHNHKMKLFIYRTLKFKYYCLKDTITKTKRHATDLKNICNT